MKNQLQTKAATLAEILRDNRLTKAASDTITHKSLQDQTSLGREQTEEVAGATKGVLASTPEAANHSSDKVEEQANAQSLNASGEEGISRDRKVKTITSDGEPTGTPAEQAKIASHYRGRLAQVLAAMDKQASLGKRANTTRTAEVSMEDFRTGTEVLEKFAALQTHMSKEAFEEAEADLVKLAATNPVFHICKDRILMRKLAEDIDALAEAEGISEDEAAAELQRAAEENPDMLAEVDEEADSEALIDLAEAEEATGELMGAIDEMAMNASSALGVEVTADDIMDAADEVAAQAEELGVPPEALIEQAIAEMQGSAVPEISPEDEANAQAILDEAAAAGISPDEVIQMAVEELEAGLPEEELPVEPVEKVASLQKRAGTSRAAFVQYLRNRR